MELLWGHQAALRRLYAAPFGGLWNSFEIPKKLYGLSIFGPLHGTPVLFKSSYLSSFWFKYYYYSALQLSISLQSRHLFFFFLRVIFTQCLFLLLSREEGNHSTVSLWQCCLMLSSIISGTALLLQYIPLSLCCYIFYKPVYC